MSPTGDVDVHPSGSRPPGTWLHVRGRIGVGQRVPSAGGARYLRVLRMEARLDQLNELMQRYSRGEDGVFEELYRLMAPRLYRFCLRLTPVRSEADDLLQGPCSDCIERAPPTWGFQCAPLDLRDLTCRPCGSPAVLAPAPGGSRLGDRPRRARPASGHRPPVAGIRRPCSRPGPGRHGRARQDVGEEQSRIRSPQGGGPQRPGGGRRARDHGAGRATACSSCLRAAANCPERSRMEGA